MYPFSKRNADQYRRIKGQFDLQSHELELCRQRLQHTSHFQIAKDVNQLQQTMGKSLISKLVQNSNNCFHLVKCEETLKRCQEIEKTGSLKVKELEDKIKNAKQFKEKELANAKKALETCQKKAEETRSKWNNKKQVGVNDQRNLTLVCQEVCLEKAFRLILNITSLFQCPVNILVLKAFSITLKTHFSYERNFNNLYTLSIAIIIKIFIIFR